MIMHFGFFIWKIILYLLLIQERHMPVTDESMETLFNPFLSGGLSHTY